MKLEDGAVYKLGAHPVDQGLLNQAVAFFNAGSRCAADISITPTVSNMPMAPAVVCFAFSLELYLKLLHVISSGAQVRGHKVDALFDSLPADLRERIARAYGTASLSDHLRAASGAFVDWRYQHEHETLTVNPKLLAAACRACHVVVRTLRPDMPVFGENHAVGTPGGA